MKAGRDATQVALTEDVQVRPAFAPDLASSFLDATVQGGAPSSVIDPRGTEVYRRLADAMLPRWRRVLAAAPSLLERKRASSHARALFHTTASALASAVHTGAARPGTVYGALRSAIESALVAWQLSHGGDGIPRTRHLRRDPLTVASTYHVVVLLCERSEFQTHLLLTDLKAHLAWLTSCSGFPPWIEARVVAALADGGVLLRDRKLVGLAEARAAAFCASARIADASVRVGWSRADLVRDFSLVSAALDPLTRLFSTFQWEFLRPALHATGKLLEVGVDRAGAIGGLRNLLRLPFPLPLGAETLVRCGFPCSRLAALCRGAAARTDASALLSWGEDLVAIIGPSAAMSANTRPAFGSVGLAIDDGPNVNRPDFEDGISIFRTPAYDALVDHRRGGAVRVRWGRTGRSQEDHGLRAVSDRVSLTSEASAFCRSVRPDGKCLITSGAFAIDQGRVPAGLTAAAGGRGPRVARRWFGLRSCGDQFERQIEFESNRITITDSFRLRRAADFVLVGANGLEDHPGPLAENQFHNSAADAVVLEGTRGATITRVFEHGSLVRREVSA